MNSVFMFNRKFMILIVFNLLAQIEFESFEQG